MKYGTKILSVLILIISLGINEAKSQITYNEWETVVLVDEFEDPTGETAERIFLKGTFSNSATSNSDLIVKIMDHGLYFGLIIELYEYSRAPGVNMCNDSCFGVMEIKDDSGETHSFKAWSSETGALYFIDDRKEILSLMEKSSKLTFLIKESSFWDIGSARYTFTLNK
ncbi:MAG: hypothetical protein U5K71_01545 [Gracilimonas sp.]|nr:hypothetical protein [Gracilimonas sp.]